jgi:thiol-disulfide isomerase/thioredoxin
MKNSSLVLALAMLAGLCVPGAPASAATLKIGDAAPPLQTGKWVQGDPVRAFDSNHVYVVEFWATWCGPCRVSIPHLNETWQKFKDKNLIVIGQDCWERDESGVPAFVKKMGDQMTYRVALDNKNKEKEGAMAINWMAAAGQDGIPTAFIINRQGKIAWIGHPMALQESVLEQILADKFDVAGFAKEFEKQQQKQDAEMALSRKLNKAMKTNDWETAAAALAEITGSLPEQMRYEVAPTRLEILLGQKNYEAAYELAATSSDAHSDNTGFLNALAWVLASSKNSDARCLALAEKIAERANQPLKDADPAILDTLARAQFRNGKTREAIATEQKALDAAPEGSKNAFAKTLKAYQEGKLPELEE